MNPSVRSASFSNKSLQLEPLPDIVFEQNGGLLVSRILKFNFRDVDWQDPCPLHVTTLSSVAVNVISIASTQLFQDKWSCFISMYNQGWAIMLQKRTRPCPKLCPLISGLIRRLSQFLNWTILLNSKNVLAHCLFALRFPFSSSLFKLKIFFGKPFSQRPHEACWDAHGFTSCVLAEFREISKF